MFTVYFINFDYKASETFTDLQAAIAYARSKSFECRIDLDGRPVHFVGPFGERSL